VPLCPLSCPNKKLPAGPEVLISWLFLGEQSAPRGMRGNNADNNGLHCAHCFYSTPYLLHSQLALAQRER
jgi:hypothetical protein